jgi:hypothetical protein
MVSVIDYNEENARPYIATYRALDVLNWATGLIDGNRVLTLLIVQEQEAVLEGFIVKKRTRYRSYRLIAGVVLYRSWAAGDGATIDSAVDTPMTRRGKTLDRIPAVFHNASHLGPEIGEAPLYDVAEINISHYMTSADLENGRHIAGLPTPWATGVDDDAKPLHLGTTRAWTTEKDTAKFGWMEFTGVGLGELVKAIEEKERQMAVLGARLLFDAKKDAESFDTVKLRATSETAALSNIAGHLTVTITQVLQWFYWWQGTEVKSSDVKATAVMNEDFVDVSIDSATLTAMVAAFQGNAISFETFYYQMKQGEVYPDEWDIEREAAAISQRPPGTMPIPPPAAPGSTPPGEKAKPGKPGDPPAKPDAKPADKTGKPAPETTPNKA